MRRHLLALLGALLVVTGGAGVAVANAPVRLEAAGPTAVTGTEASAVFTIAERTLRQVRYHDKEVLSYSFELRNDGSLPVTVTGLRPLEREPRLFEYVDLLDEEGAERFTLPPGTATRVALRNCETLSARAGSFASRVALSTTRAGLLDRAERKLRRRAPRSRRRTPAGLRHRARRGPAATPGPRCRPPAGPGPAPRCPAAGCVRSAASA